MYPPIYRYDKSDKAMFFDLVRRSNGVALTEKDVHVSPPRKESGNHTSVILAPTQHSPLSGQVEVFYDRLDLSRFFFGIPLSFTGISEINPETISNVLLNRWSVWVNPNDLLIEITQFEPHHPVRLKLTALHTSLTWVGTVEAWVLPEGHLGQVFDDYALSYNDGNVKRNAFLYSIDQQINDVSLSTSAFLQEGQRLFTNDPVVHPFLQRLEELSGDPWVIVRETAPFNLMDAVVTYHGPVSDENPNHRVIVLHLSPYCKNLFGNLLLYYTLTDLTDTTLDTELDGFTL